MDDTIYCYSRAVEHPALIAAKEVVRTMTLRGCTALIVGGAVRDLILNREIREVDLVTDMRPEDMSSLFRTYEPGKSRDFKTLCIVHRGHHFETTMFRGIEWGIKPERLHCQGEQYKNFILFQDAAHRDFTINAMFLDEEFNLIDPHNGLKDLRAGLLKGVQDPPERFREDPLRMLRAVRLSVQLGLRLEKYTFSSIKFLAHRITWVAPERLGSEIFKMASLSGPEFAKGMEMMEETGLLGLLLPEVQALKDISGVADQRRRNLFEQTVAVLIQNRAARPELNLALLTHALGRPETGGFDPAGPVHTGSRGYEPKLIQDMSKRLRLAKKTVQAMHAVAARHRRIENIHQLQPSQIVNMIEDRHWNLLVTATRCIVAARKGKAAKKFDENLSLAMNKVSHAVSELNRSGVRVKTVITGRQVMENTGLEPGPAVGRIIRETTMWARDHHILDEEKIISHARQLAQMIRMEEDLRSSVLSGPDHGENQS